MEFGLEMIIRAAEENLDIREIPIELHPRGGVSKLAPFRDGWRSLHMILIHSPRHLFMLPGLLMAVVGVAIGAVVLTGVDLFGRPWYAHALIGGALLLILGVQVLGLGFCGEVYATDVLQKRGTLVERLRRRGLGLRHAYWLGSVLMLCGLVLGCAVIVEWAQQGFGPLAEEQLAITAMTLLVVGAQTIFISLFLSLLGLGRGASIEAPRVAR